MNKNIQRILFLFFLVLSTFAKAAVPEPGKKDPPSNKEIILPEGMSAARSQQLQAALQRALANINPDVVTSAPYEHAEQPLVAPETNAARDSAAKVFDNVKYITELNVLNQELPIGIKETIGNTSVEIAISKYILYPAYGEITIYCRMHFKDSKAPNGERDVFFGATGIKIANGGIMDEAKLVLLGDVALPFGGNTFTIKGGYNENTGASKSLTYVIIDCKGFRELSINGELKLSRSIVQPFDEEKRAPKPGNVIIPIL
ncbi:MAG: hypothetical protein ACRCVT_14745, partial [Leadbetterella sp.]